MDFREQLNSWKPLIQHKSASSAIWFTNDSVCHCFTHKVWFKEKNNNKEKKKKETQNTEGGRLVIKLDCSIMTCTHLVHICTCTHLHKNFSWASGTGLLYQWTFVVLRLHEHISCLFLESAAPNTGPCTKWNKCVCYKAGNSFLPTKTVKASFLIWKYWCRGECCQRLLT